MPHFEPQQLPGSQSLSYPFLGKIGLGLGRRVQGPSSRTRVGLCFLEDLRRQNLWKSLLCAAASFCGRFDAVIFVSLKLPCDVSCGGSERFFRIKLRLKTQLKVETLPHRMAGMGLSVGHGGSTHPKAAIAGLIVVRRCRVGYEGP